MARILSQTLARGSQTLLRDPSPSHLLSRSRANLLPAASRLVSLRFRSSRAGKGELVEIELEADASGGGGEVEVVGMKRLEDAIHGIIVRRSAPDWLPFRPGSSYWVPPRKGAIGLVELVGRLANPLTEEETLALTTVRGWPSSAYFVEGRDVTSHTVKRPPKKAASQSDDEE